MSFLTGEEIRRSIKPWEPRDARDFYLGAAVYAYLFLLTSRYPTLASGSGFQFEEA